MVLTLLRKKAGFPDLGIGKCRGKWHPPSLHHEQSSPATILSHYNGFAETQQPGCYTPNVSRWVWARTMRFEGPGAHTLVSSNRSPRRNAATSPTLTLKPTSSDNRNTVYEGLEQTHAGRGALRVIESREGLHA